MKGWVTGLEPVISRTTIWRANQLHHTHHKTSLGGFEPSTYGLEGRCSIQLSYRLISLTTPKTNCFRKAGDGNRTHVSSLEGWCSTIELHPHACGNKFTAVGVTGFEPAASWSQTRRSSQAEPHPDISFISLPLRLCVSFVSPAATRYIIWHVSQKVNRFFKVFLLFYDCFFTCFSQEECANCFFCFSFLIIRTIIDIFAQNSFFRPHRLP